MTVVFISTWNVGGSLMIVVELKQSIKGEETYLC